MIAAKHAAAYDAELKQLFAVYNLRGDGVIHEDEFNMVQSLVAAMQGSTDTKECPAPPRPFSHTSSAPKVLPPRRSLAAQILEISLNPDTSERHTPMRPVACRGFMAARDC